MGGRVEEVQMPIQGLALRGAERESAAQLINLAEITQDRISEHPIWVIPQQLGAILSSAESPC